MLPARQLVGRVIRSQEVVSTAQGNLQVHSPSSLVHTHCCWHYIIKTCNDIISICPPHTGVLVPRSWPEKRNSSWHFWNTCRQNTHLYRTARRREIGERGETAIEREGRRGGGRGKEGRREGGREGRKDGSFVPSQILLSINRLQHHYGGIWAGK